MPASLLGKPPAKPRVVGSIPRLSSAFIRAHGRNTSENVKQNKSKEMKPRKKPNQKPETKLNKRLKPSVKTAILVDLTTKPEEARTVASSWFLDAPDSRRCSESEGISSPDLIDLDSPDFSDQFGEPLIEDASCYDILQDLNC